MAKILIVEDDTNFQKPVKEQLEKNILLFFTTNGMDALRIISSNSIDLLITDISMPKMNGFELIEMIRSYIPIIIFTISSNIEDKKIGFRLGADDYLTKPINYIEMNLRIDALFRRIIIKLNLN